MVGFKWFVSKIYGQDMGKYKLPIKCEFQIEFNVSKQDLWDVCLWNIDGKHVGYVASAKTVEEALENFAKDLPNHLV